jgi:zinc protease
MLDRTIPPPFKRNSSFDLHKPDIKILSNGIQAYFIPGGTQDVIKIDFIFKAGRWFEKSWGAAYFSAHLLSKGTATKTSFEIAQIFDKYGAHLELNPGLDFVSISLYSLTRNLEPVFNLVIELITQAALPEKELDQLKSIYQQNLKVNNEKTSFLASKLFRKNLFGEGHPYGKELDEQNISALTRNQIAEHLSAFYQDIVVFISGKIDDSNRSLINGLLKNLPAKTSSTSPSKFPDIKSISQREEKQGSVQASIRLGKKSVLRSNKDYADVLFLSHILGGYFGSRLMKNIREEKGLTYGIHASLHALKHDSYLVIGADVNKENIDLTITEIKKELRKLKEEPIDINELEIARNHFIGGLQSELTTSFAHAEKIKTITLFGLDDTYYNNLIARIEEVKASDLQKAGEQYFSSDSFLEIAVG